MCLVEDSGLTLLIPGLGCQRAGSLGLDTDKHCSVSSRSCQLVLSASVGPLVLDIRACFLRPPGLGPQVSVPRKFSWRVSTKALPSTSGLPESSWCAYCQGKSVCLALVLSPFLVCKVLFNYNSSVYYESLLRITAKYCDEKLILPKNWSIFLLHRHVAKKTFSTQTYHIVDINFAV